MTDAPSNSKHLAEAWLETNRRALLLGLVLPGMMTVTALAALGWAVFTGQHVGLMLLFSLLAAAPLWMVGELLYALTQPRLGYQNGQLLVYLEPVRPTRIPIDIVEVFFLGQGPSELPKLRGREPETQNVIIRLADSATDWKHRDVRPAIGLWCEGYITIRGSWCEPITPDLLRRLNHRLAEIHRERKAAAATEGNR